MTTRNTRTRIVVGFFCVEVGGDDGAGRRSPAASAPAPLLPAFLLRPEYQLVLEVEAAAHHHHHRQAVPRTTLNHQRNPSATSFLLRAAFSSV